MKKRLLMGMLCVLSILLIGGICTARIVPSNRFGNEPSEAQRQFVVSKLSSMPLSFTENKGQFGERTKFRCDAMGATFYFAAGEVAYLFTQETDELIEDDFGLFANMAIASGELNRPRYQREGLLVRARFVGTNPDAKVVGEGLLPHRSNYFLGNDPSKWRTDVPSYSAVRYGDIYPGIDLRYYGDGQSLKYDFIVQPGADPSRIEIEYEGVTSLSINAKGELLVSTRFGNVIERVPYVYHEIGGDRQEIPCRYTILYRDRFGFVLEGDYDRSQRLYIDPELSYSTYLGGSSADEGRGIAVDSSGNVYVTGYTYSTDFPMANPYQGSINGDYDVFVTKLSASGDSLVYSTYLGGSGVESGGSIAVDSSGNVYVTGYTYSIDFPMANPYQGNNNGLNDVFVTKLSTSGDSLAYSTYIGGSSYDFGFGIAVDGEGFAYMTGYTKSTDFPTVNSYDESLDGWRDAFVTKLSASGDSLVYSTYLGGSSTDEGRGIAVDGEGFAYVTGETWSTNFPTTNPYDGSLDDEDAFVTKLSASGDSLVYSTYLGGNLADCGRGIAVNSLGNAYVTGNTDSPDFPTADAFDGSYNGNWDVFVTKLSASGDSLAYSTYLGGNNEDYGRDIAVDGSGDAYATGWIWSTDFPTVNPYQSGFGGGECDAFVAKLDIDGTPVVSATPMAGLSKTHTLSQNYPNPFNPITEIKYALPKDCYVRLEVFNILGQKVASLVDGEQKAGYKVARWDASKMSSGIYFYRLQVRRTPHSYGAGDFTETRKMILIR